MERSLREKIAFYLTGRRSGTDLEPLNRHFRPALFSRYADLSSLRYDFPLILNDHGPVERSIVSLSSLVDEAIASLTAHAQRDRIARHGYLIEKELRQRLATHGFGHFATLWESVVADLSDGHEGLVDSANQLWQHFEVSGEIANADARLPARLIRHTWQVVRRAKTLQFEQRISGLLVKLHEILDADFAGSLLGRSPERLRASVGTAFAGAFDFDSLSRVLVESKPGTGLSDERRRRIEGLIEVLENQRMFAVGDSSVEMHNFEFESCSELLDAYRNRHAESAELLKTLAIAELEVKGEYREPTHNVLFSHFGENGLDASEIAKLPDYLLCLHGGTLDPSEIAKVPQLLATGLPLRVFVQTDDILSLSGIREGHVSLGLTSQQFVAGALALADVFVLQIPASHFVRMTDSIIRGLTYQGPTLISVFSGDNGFAADTPPYLIAAAALESRAFPALVFDPMAETDGLDISRNQHPLEEWPVHKFMYEDADLQMQRENIAFTLADFLATDDRFFEDFAVLPAGESDADLRSVPEQLNSESSGMPTAVPHVLVVDQDNRLRRAIVDARVVKETRRCLAMWRGLQKRARARVSPVEPQSDPAREPAESVPKTTTPDDKAALNGHGPGVIDTTSEVAKTAEAISPAADSGEPWIETDRCTSCNECTNVNSRMFAYNENKQAYIADPDAGTFRQLVEAAEGCQVSIIHPGKPRNPKEPGLEDLIQRAAEFN